MDLMTPDCEWTVDLCPPPARIIERSELEKMFDGLDRTLTSSVNPRLVAPPPLATRLMLPGERGEANPSPGSRGKLSRGAFQAILWMLVCVLAVGAGTMAATYFFQVR